MTNNEQIIIDVCPYQGECSVSGCKRNDDGCFVRRLFEERNRAEKELYSKEQECERLKKIIDEAKNSKLDLKSFLVGEAIQNEYEQQLGQLKKENEELKKKIKGYQCNEKNTNRCTCAFRCLENTFCNDAENKIDEIQTKIKILKIENEILSNKLEQEENWHKTSDEIGKVNSEYTAKLKQTIAEIKEIALEACLCCGECQTEFSEKDYCDFKQILQKINGAEDVETTNALGKEHVWYSKEEVNKMFDEIKQITVQYTDVPCLEANWKCESCPDEITDYGKTCMQNGINKIKKIIEGVQND